MQQCVAYPITYLYDDVIMDTIASQITSLTSVYSTVYSGADHRKHQSSASLAFVWGIHRGPVNSPHKWPVTRKMFPFDDVIMWWLNKQSARGRQSWIPKRFNTIFFMVLNFKLCSQNAHSGLISESICTIKLKACLFAATPYYRGDT